MVPPGSSDDLRAPQLFRLYEENMNRPIILIHGYSDNGKSFRTWREKLGSGEPAWKIDTISAGNYQSLTDEVTIKDLADGLDRALHEIRGTATIASVLASGTNIQSGIW